MDNSIQIALNRFIQRLRLYDCEFDAPIEWFVIFSRKTQAQMILWHLQKFGKITNQQAREIYGINYCPSVIKDLRDMFRKKQAPYQITNVTIDGINRWGKKTTYDEYTLEEGK